MRETDTERTGPNVDVGALSEEDRLTARLVRKNEYVSEEDLRDAVVFLQGQTPDGGERSLMAILHSRGLLNEKHLRAVQHAIKLYRDRAPDRAFVQLAARRKLFGRYEAEEAFRRQADLYRQTGRLTPVWDVLVEYGVITSEQRAELLRSASVREAVAGSDAEGRPEGGRESAPSESREEAADERGESAEEEGPAFDVVVAPDLLSARVVARTSEPARLTADAIYEVLQHRGIVQGLLRRDEIEKWLASGVSAGKSLIVAYGNPPRPGQSAEVRYHVQQTPTFRVPSEDDDDLKGGGRIPGVTKGTLLAEKTPMIPETHGMDVFGHEILVEVAKDVLMLSGSGIDKSADGLKLYAAADGRVEFSALGKLAVLPELIIYGDIGYETGNIEFDGIVEVRGIIQDGFRVKAGSLMAREISKATVEVFGNLSVSGGILGATIRSQGTVSAVHVHASRIEAQGDVTVDRGIVDSRVISSGRCILPRGTILSSAVAARLGIEVRQVGSDRSGPCTLVFNIDPLTERELARLKEIVAGKDAAVEEVRGRTSGLREALEREEKDVGHLVQDQDFAGRERRNLVEKIDLCRSSGQVENLEPLEKSLENLDRRMREADAALDKRLAVQDDLRDRITACQEEVRGIEAEIAAVRDEMQALVEMGKGGKVKPSVKVYGTAFSGTVVKGAMASMVLDGDLRGVMFREVRGEKGEKGATGDMTIRISGVS